MSVNELKQSMIAGLVRRRNELASLSRTANSKLSRENRIDQVLIRVRKDFVRLNNVVNEFVGLPS